MNNILRIVLIIFCLIWLVELFRLIKKGKLPIKYSLIWFFPIIVLILLIIVPGFIESICNIVGLASVNNFIIGLILTILLIISLILTLIIANLKRKVTLLIQEISIIKEKK